MAHIVGRKLSLLNSIAGVRILKFCSYSASATPQSSQPEPSYVTLLDESYPSDTWTNISNPIKAVLPRKLHLNPSHPIGILRNIIEARFPSHVYTRYADLSPVVSLEQNFDSLGIPTDHPSRSKTDTYYVNSSTVLRTHSSAHQADIFRRCPTPGFLLSADVYRRDEIDRNHYPAFHQMEGAMTWNLSAKSEDISAIQKSIDAVPTVDITVEDSKEHFHAGNPLQTEYSPTVAAAVATHLKRTLEDVVQEIFHQAHTKESRDKVKMRWIDAYFPFTSPSYELEVFWEGSWLELLGCGVVTQKVLGNAGVPDKLGWAFGIGLDRLAMVLFGVPDIRLFWSQDERFLSQFQPRTVSKFKAFSKYPSSYRDISFWINSVVPGVETNLNFHENDLMEILREEGGDIVESARLWDTFKHPKTGRMSQTYRVNYQSMERSLTSPEIDAIDVRARARIAQLPGIEMR